MNGLVDSFVTLGRPAAPEGMPYLTPEALLADMDRLGINEAYCADYRALEGSARVGNQLLCNALRNHPRLHPVWVVLPESTEETAPPEQFIQELNANAVRLVRAEPVKLGYSTKEWCAASLWAALETAHIPILLDMGERWDDLATLLVAHSNLPVILTRVGYRSCRTLYPLLKAHPNLHFELSSFMTNEGVADVVNLFGTERILFGTDAPRYAPECALGTLRFAGLTETDFQMVASGNLKRLLEGVS